MNTPDMEQAHIVRNDLLTSIVSEHRQSPMWNTINDQFEKSAAYGRIDAVTMLMKMNVVMPPEWVNCIFKEAECFLIFERNEASNEN